VLLTITVLEFFGPILRDTGDTHLLNPEWVGHARFHLAWMLVFMGLSGLCCLALIWGHHPRQGRLSHLYIAWMWQACNIFGFWGAAALESSYDGMVVDPHFHFTVFGLNENIAAFIGLTTVLTASMVWLKWGVEPWTYGRDGGAA
ncbi:MAG: hypothetical protein AAFX99_35555, partial [Myxococcota bacterium]